MKGHTPASLAACLTAAKPGMSGPRTGSTMQSESSALPVSSASPSRMPATCTSHKEKINIQSLVAALFLDELTFRCPASNEFRYCLWHIKAQRSIL